MDLGHQLDLRTLASQIAACAPLDERIIDLWLEGKSPSTQRVYLESIRRFLAFTGQPIVLTTYSHLVDYGRVLKAKGNAARTVNRQMNTIKSILTFCQRQWWTLFNVGHSYRIAAVFDDLDERILSQEEILSIIAAEPDLRNCLFMVLLYYGGLRRGTVLAHVAQHPLQA